LQRQETNVNLWVCETLYAKIRLNVKLTPP